MQVNSATNQVPLALADSYNVEYETELSVDEISGLLANDTDADVNDVLIVILDTDVSNGTLALNEDGSFTYTPDTGFGGTDSFTYYATDGLSDSAAVQVELVVDGPFVDTDLLAHLTLDDDLTPAIAMDSSVFGNDGAITGATYVPESGDGSSSSLSFDGDDVVNLGGLDVNGTGVTLAAWVKADSFPGANLDLSLIHI